MTIHRYAAKRDRVERTLLSQLRSIPGLSITQLSGAGVPDLLVGYQGHTLLVEVKSRKSARFTADQLAFQEAWTGTPVVRAECVEDVLLALDILRRERDVEPVEPGTQDVVVRLMDKAEAEACVEDIRRGLDNVFARFAELYDREGWRALGYTSWRACIEEEFGYKKSHAYRMLAAARIDLALSALGEAERRERHLREVASLDPEQAGGVLQLAEQAWAAHFPDQAGQMTSLWVKAARNVMEESFTTGGYVDVGEGVQVPFHAGAATAVKLEADELRQRQRLHIQEKSGTLLLSERFLDLESGAVAVTKLLDRERYTAYRIIVYGEGARVDSGASSG